MRGRPKKLPKAENDGPRQQLALALTGERERVPGKPSQRRLAEVAGLGLTTVQQAEDEEGRLSLETLHAFLDACWSMTEANGQSAARDYRPFEELYYRWRPRSRPVATPRKTSTAWTRILVGAVVASLVLTMIAVGDLTGRLPWPGPISAAAPAPPSPDLASTCPSGRLCAFETKLGVHVCLDRSLATNTLGVHPCHYYSGQNGANEEWVVDYQGPLLRLRSNYRFQHTPYSANDDPSAGCVSVAVSGGRVTMDSCQSQTTLLKAIPVPGGGYALHPAAATGLCLDYVDRSRTNTSPALPVSATRCDGDAHQQWVPRLVVHT